MLAWVLVSGLTLKWSLRHREAHAKPGNDRGQDESNVHSVRMEYPAPARPRSSSAGLVEIHSG